MANVIKLQKGLDIVMKGKAACEKKTVKAPDKYALVPDDFCGLKPKVVVREGDVVKAGDALFVDKLHPEVQYCSPVSGKVVAVTRGDRRKLLNVTVESDGKGESVDFGKKAPKSLSGAEVKECLMKAGLFGFFRSRPYDVVANPEDEPKAIFVSALQDMPLAQDFEFVLKGQEADFQTGLDALARIAPVNLGVGTKQNISANGVNVYAFDGKCPAGNVGVQINHISPINKGEVVWTMGAEEVIMVGRLFNKGVLDMTRTIAVGGECVKAPAYAEVKVGQCICTLVKECVSEGNVRLIGGNALTGRKLANPDFLPAHATELTAIPEGDDNHEMLGWIMPRFNQFSASRTYFSWLLGKKAYSFDSRVKGGERHMIMSGEYDRVFPMDIYPEQLVKAIIAGDIDRMEALGIYEVAPEDFALCEFVCSSKVEVQRIVREGLDMLRKEMA